MISMKNVHTLCVLPAASLLGQKMGVLYFALVTVTTRMPNPEPFAQANHQQDAGITQLY